jgi:hypothetical protein
MKTIDFAKTHKELYTATRKIKEVSADAAVYLAVESQGEPGGRAFQDAIMALYSAVYTLKFSLKHAGRMDFKVAKLECLYFSDPAETPRDQWRWQLLVRVPEELTAADLTAAKKAIREKGKGDAAAVKRLRLKGGRALQVLHVGPYCRLCESYGPLMAHAAEQGLTLSGPAHEVYLSDPRRVAPEKLKTIIRLPVAKRRAK